MIVIILLVVIGASFVFNFKGDIDYGNTIAERRGEEPRGSVLGMLAFVLVAGAAIFVLFNH